MQNDAGECVDMFIPRRCSATSRVIAAKDHASVQIAIAQVDEKGFATGSSIPIAICGQIRKMGESDDCINRLAKKEDILSKNF